MSNTHFGYIIIGGGTAGCLLANRVSVGPCRHDPLIEAGRADAAGVFAARTTLKPSPSSRSRTRSAVASSSSTSKA